MLSKAALLAVGMAATSATGGAVMVASSPVPSQVEAAQRETSMIKKTLLASVFIAAVSGAHAQTCTTDPSSGNTFCDPSSFHVTSPSATGSDPVLLNESNTLTITEVGNHTINQPIRVLLLEPLGSALPSITSATGVGASGPFSLGPQTTVQATAFDQTNGTFDGPVVTLSAGQDVGKQFNLPGADASVSYTNIAAAYAAAGLVAPATFQIEDAVIPVAFNSDSDFLTLNGSFGLGTVIAPIAVDVETQSNGKLKITTFDTAWTNAGFVNQTSVIPEPQTWVMLIAGFGFMGWLGYRRQGVVRRA